MSKVLTADGKVVEETMELKTIPFDTEKKEGTLDKYEQFKLFTPDLCIHCGVVYLVPKAFMETRIKKKTAPNSIWCPNGHSGQMTRDWEETAKKNCPPIDTFVKITCDGCATPFMVPREFDERKHSNYSTFFCPGGCRQSYQRPAPPPKTEEQVDYSKMLSYHSALASIALLKPTTFGNKKKLKLAINIARNAIDLEALKEDK